jgi:hypothetical protein
MYISPLFKIDEMFLSKYYRLIILIFVIIPLSVVGQNNTSSPYSYFGAGELSNVAYGRNLGLGSTGLALRSQNFLNLKNPASLSAIDSLTVLFETGVFAKHTLNKSSVQENRYIDGNLSHVVLGHRYTSRFMGSYGIMPYSDIGYYFQTFKSIQGDDKLMVTNWNGSGAINKMFYGLAFKINKNFSIGNEFALYYGSVNQVRETYSAVSGSNYTQFVTNSRYSGVSVMPGIQYLGNIGDKGSQLVIGAVYSPAQVFFGESEYSVNQYYGSTTRVPIYYSEPRVDPIKIPESYGVGVSYTWQGKLLATGDYNAEMWGSNGGSYVDRKIYSFGVERLPQNSLDYFDRCSFRVGFRYDNGYFTVRDYPITDMRVTLGAGFPIQRSRSTINVSVEAGQQGRVGAGLVRERYAKLSIALSFHDYWFLKRKID